jgi:NADH-quinone oxidoreductase subunit L
MLDFFADKPGRWFVVVTFLPLAAAVILLLAGTIRRLTNPTAKPSRLPGYFACGVMLLATGIACYSTYHLIFEEDTFLVRPTKMIEISTELKYIEKFNWISLGKHRLTFFTADHDTFFYQISTTIELGYDIDAKISMLASMVCIITSFVMIFSLRYMESEASVTTEDHTIHHNRRGRFGQFFMYLLLFAFSMLFLLISLNLLQTFIGWELVGVSSYFLIGFYTERNSATQAALKALIMNRVGDAGFLVGIFLLWGNYGSLMYGAFDSSMVTPRLWIMNENVSIAVGWLCVFLGCMAKSAQWPLHTWLPDAMEGPTPVSALIHAATMVAAGVFLVCRLNFTRDVYDVIAIIGGVSMLLGAIFAIQQTDIKKVLAYSTMSQLGFMMLTIGMGAMNEGLFHLLTHAFFKALLFLAAGSVIYSLHHLQDLRQMGGLWRKMPITAATMLVGVLAISGFPFTAGWTSKDLILTYLVNLLIQDTEFIAFYPLSTMETIGCIIPFLAAILTSYYMLKLWLLSFLGNPRSEEAAHAKEGSPLLTVPLLLLSVISFCGTWGWPVWDAHHSYATKLMSARQGEIGEGFIKYPDPAAAIGLVLGITCFTLGFGAALFHHFTRNPKKIRGDGLFAKALYFDELYHFLFVRPVAWLGAVAARRDKGEGVTVDAVVSGPTLVIPTVGERLRRVQSGNVRQYVLALALTLAVVLGILLFR